MRNTVKSTLIIAAIALFSTSIILSSCTKNDVAAVSDSQDAVMLMQNAAADNNQSKFDSTMCNGKSKNGKSGNGPRANDSLYTHTKLTQANLPATIISYISTNYPTATFKDAVKIVQIATGAAVSYLVLLDNASVKTGLRFDGAGVFVNARTGGKTGLGMKGVETAVDISKIPTTATAYITTKYVGYTSKSALSVAINGTIVAYRVVISNGIKNKELIFDANWSFIHGH